MLPLSPGLSTGVNGPGLKCEGDVALQASRALVACDEAAVRYYLSQGLDPDMQLTGGHTPLTLVITRATSGHWETIARLLLESGASPHCRDPRGVPVLMMFIKSCSSQLVRLALERGASLDVQGPSGDTPLLTAVHYMQLECVQLFLERGADPNAAAEDGNSPLMWAAGRNNGRGAQRSLECVRLLLQYGADPTFQNPRGYSPLMAAAIIREQEIVKTLLQAGAPPDAHDSRGETALMKATDADAIEVVQALVAGRANVNAASNSGGTPIMSALSIEVARYLLEHRAIPGLADIDGTTALHHRAASDRVDIAHVLLWHGAPLEARDKQGNTPLQIAVRARSHGITNLLLDAGADPTTINDAGASLPHEALLPWDYYATHNVFPALNTPVLRAELVHYIASGAAQAELILKRLLEGGADPGLPGDGGTTPLMLAAASGQELLLRILMDAGAPIDATDSEGRTALAYACRWGHYDVVQVLLAHHTPVNTLDDSHNLPIFYAAHLSHMPIVLDLMVQFAFFMCYSV